MRTKLLRMRTKTLRERSEMFRAQMNALISYYESADKAIRESARTDKEKNMALKSLQGIVWDAAVASKKKWLGAEVSNPLLSITD